MDKNFLRTKILDHAYEILKEKGISNIPIRALAQKSGCSVGSVYNIFEDFEDIQFHLNIRTLKLIFQELYTDLEKAIKKKVTLEELVPHLGWVYIQFGKEHYHCWKSLFELAPDSPQPKWYAYEIAKNLGQFEKCLIEEYSLSKEQANQLINYFWFSVHGVSSIILNRKATNTSDGYIKPYVDHCLKGIFINYENKLVG